MGVFEMVVVLMAIGTGGKLVQAWIQRSPRGPGPGSDARIEALEREVQTSETRLAIAEERVEDLTEKLSFLERLLAEPGRSDRLPPPAP